MILDLEPLSFIAGFSLGIVLVFLCFLEDIL